MNAMGRKIKVFPKKDSLLIIVNILDPYCLHSFNI